MNAAFSDQPSALDQAASLRRHVATCGQSISATLAAWRARRRERVELAQLTPAELRDAGITRYEARIEARKPFWRA